MNCAGGATGHKSARCIQCTSQPQALRKVAALGGLTRDTAVAIGVANCINICVNRKRLACDSGTSCPGAHGTSAWRWGRTHTVPREGLTCPMDTRTGSTRGAASAPPFRLDARGAGAGAHVVPAPELDPSTAASPIAPGTSSTRHSGDHSSTVGLPAPVAPSTSSSNKGVAGASNGLPRPGSAPAAIGPSAAPSPARGWPSGSADSRIGSSSHTRRMRDP